MFCGVDEVGSQFAISQLIWEIGFCVAIILDRSIGGISAGCIGVNGGVNYNFIIDLFSSSFLFFMVLVEYGASLRFLNEYEELESV